ncbi:Glycoside hydrolase, family 27 [Dillenia turbinata]|uniref:Alpha-galactosidase n=1 Tax=Dillenia turbinata TaxID=194707 RepID=A0AAN8V7T6_9MAGN
MKMKMNIFSFLYLYSLLFSLLNIHRVSSRNVSDHASSPPRGWNSYDSFCWTISEQEFLHNAELISQRLLPHGYEYAVVDYLWYRRKVPGASVESLGFDVIDEWGRMIPDPDRWPSSKDGKGFTEVAKKVHSLGLKFGIHVMRGLGTQAFNANTPILDITTGGPYQESGRQWRAQDMGLKERACAWMPHGFMSVNTNLGAGRAFLRSVYTQYAEWGVDFVKHDCVFGDDLDIAEISFVSEVLEELDRPILYSLSPGTSVTPAMAKNVIGLVNMYRITGDDWDSWGDVASHFDVTRDFSVANMIGASGLKGKSWPDLDMLPLGWLTDPGSNEGPHRKCNLNLDEQKTQMTLWSIAKSPLMFGGDVRALDDSTYNLITNPIILEINSFSSNNKEFPYATAKHNSKGRKQVLPGDSGLLKDDGKMDACILSLTSCGDLRAKGWTSETRDQDIAQVCWKDSLRSKNQAPFCLYKRRPLLAAQQYEVQPHLLASDTAGFFCLDASPKKKLTSKELRRGTFSPCKWDSNQLWELSHNGTLINSYSGQCAIINTVEANVVSSGVRAWVATGRQGQLYLAFFNLYSERITMSAKISDLASALPAKNLKNSSCKGKEIWTGKYVGATKESISAAVESHGCALFVLYCK